jgi:transcriptional regulator with PAS, ATPase and Fis domain
VIACGVGEGDRNLVLKSIKAGAKEYLPLPPDPKLIADMFDIFIQNDRIAIFEDPKMKEVVALAGKVAPTDASVLITGESGTGKEVLARHIHEKSRKPQKKFLSVNCAAIPENLLESELFGHEKGAFTGAIARRIGKFEEANGGTLLLDEITEMHPRLQAKLLRALQEKEIDRVGGDKPIPVNFRLIATSNRDMQEAIRDKIFREDLYFRLNVITIHLPPLRERPGDIPSLAKHFVEKYARINGIAEPMIHPETLQKLQAYSWPGNVRELENVMHRGVLMTDGGVIKPEHLQLSSRQISGYREMERFVGRSLQDLEKEFVLSTFAYCDRDSMRAAELLGLSLRTFQAKMEDFEKPQKRKV